ncbi:hypothetical protein ACSXC5_16875 (plasmid) [Clostridium perfringens]|uniref:Uncharacterized protein n=1 Tax=Clostridium perfringens TaxID=1502 RepID=A0A126G972_CLOPF|nr:hypothetical protein [Clostridium perfringens]ALD82555.1 hypothetical protein JFP838_pB0021 [Clostridium perfringens]
MKEKHIDKAIEIYDIQINISLSKELGKQEALHIKNSKSLNEKIVCYIDI